MLTYAWRPIADLPTDWEDLARPDLQELLGYWNDERQYAAESERVRQVEERLATRWAIETGAIERLYTIAPETTELLVELGLDTIDECVAAGQLTESAARLIEDQRAALDLACSGRRDGPTPTSAGIRELHQLLMRHQTHADAIDQHGNRFQVEVIRGSWKRRPNHSARLDGSIQSFCPPEQVQDELDRLFTLHRQHVEQGVRPEVEAAWLHHRFTQIHPFQDGTGRVARSLATMVYRQAGYPPLVILSDEHRDAYLDALAEADNGDLEPLVELFANVISADLNEAITFVRSAHGRDVHAIALAAADAARRHVIHSDPGLRAVTDHYRQIAGVRLREVAGEISGAFSAAIPGLHSTQLAWIVPDASDGGRSNEARGRWREQIVRAAGEYGYVPDLSHYRRWVALKLPVATADALPWHIVVSLHHKVSRAGVMAAVLFMTTLEDTFSSASGADDRPVILGGRRELTFSDSHPHDERFSAWLEAALTNALEEWQARI
jgi:Fic family protein